MTPTDEVSEDTNPMETDPAPEAEQVTDAEVELNSTIMALRGAGVSEDDIVTALDNILTGLVGEEDGDVEDADGDAASNPPTAAARTDPGYVRAVELGHVKPNDDAE